MHRREDGAAALLGEARHPFRHRLRNLDVVGIKIVDLGQPPERGPSQRATVPQIALGDQCLLRVPGQPTLPGPDQLVDLVGAHPVVLGVVEHGQQHVQVVERICQPQPTGQPQRQIAGVAPFRHGRIERDRGGRHGPAERFEDPQRQSHATPTRQRRQDDLQLQRGRGQLRTTIAAARHRRSKDLGQRGAEQRRRGVRAVVDILRQ